MQSSAEAVKVRQRVTVRLGDGIQGPVVAGCPPLPWRPLGHHVERRGPRRLRWADDPRLQQHIEGLLGGLQLVWGQASWAGECRRTAASAEAVLSWDRGRVTDLSWLERLQDGGELAQESLDGWRLVLTLLDDQEGTWTWTVDGDTWQVQ